ncbi:MAG: hypothetical protein AABW61_01420 [Candidatus Aenigmatarchaeota archaeon]
MINNIKAMIFDWDDVVLSTEKDKFVNNGVNPTMLISSIPKLPELLQSGFDG